MDDLIRLLADPERTVRRRTVQTLGAIGPPAKAANDKLFALAKDPNIEQVMKRYVTRAIFSINPELRKPKKEE